MPTAIYTSFRFLPPCKVSCILYSNITRLDAAQFIGGAFFAAQDHHDDCHHYRDRYQWDSTKKQYADQDSQSWTHFLLESFLNHNAFVAILYATILVMALLHVAPIRTGKLGRVWNYIFTAYVVMMTGGYSFILWTQ